MLRDEHRVPAPRSLAAVALRQCRGQPLGHEPRGVLAHRRQAPAGQVVALEGVEVEPRPERERANAPQAGVDQVVEGWIIHASTLAAPIGHVGARKAGASPPATLPGPRITCQ